VEQDVFTASRIADYLYILTGGKVIVHGKPDEVLSNKEFISTYLGTSLDYSFAR
jgi:ABC-type branched-subunit amino acid transport system ATPase component